MMDVTHLLGAFEFFCEIPLRLEKGTKHFL